MNAEQIKQRIEDMERQLAELKAAASQMEQADEWPKVGGHVFVVLANGTIGRRCWTGADADRTPLSAYNAFRTEAEAIRRREALKVQAELHRMPGRCGPPDGRKNSYCIAHCHDFYTEYALEIGAMSCALAGVWFESHEAAKHALDTIGQQRLQLWLDDYLQVPVEGGAE